MFFLLRVLLTLVSCSMGLWCAFLLARRLAAVERASLRVATTLTLFLAMQHVGFELLTALRVLRPVVALGFWSILSVVLHWTCQGRTAKTELHRVTASVFAGARQIILSPARAIFCAWAAAVTVARLVGGLLVPPLSWDALTYHAFKPARWVHYGFQIRQLAPDQWRYKEYFPQAGEYPWAWAMLGSGNDALLPFAGFLMWASCGFVAYGLARSLGGKQVPSFYAGLVTVFIPAICVEMVTGYVDTFVLLAFLLAATALVELEKKAAVGRAALLGLALGLLVGAKSSGFVIAGLGLLGCAFIVLGAKAPKGRGLFALAMAVATLLLVMAPNYLRTLLETGSPFYPLTVKIGKHVLFHGNAELNLLYARKLTAAEQGAASFATLFRALFIPFRKPGHEYMGFGPGYLLLVPSALIAWIVRLARRRLWVSTLTIVAMTVLPILYLLSDNFAAQRAQWYIVMGRLIANLPAILAIYTAQLAGRIARLFLILTLLSGLALAWPLGWAPPTMWALRDLLPTLVLATVAGLTCGLLTIGASRKRLLLEWGLLSSLAAFLAVLAIPLGEVRAKYRYRIYQAAASPDPAFVMHLVWDFYASAWPIWRYLDDGRPHRIAVSYGWDGIGHNGLRYPLTGSHFQNEVLYVPISTTGEIIDYREEGRISQVMDEARWLARLAENRIDYVVLGSPLPLELSFIEKHPREFTLVAESADGEHRAYRFGSRGSR